MLFKKSILCISGKKNKTNQIWIVQLPMPDRDLESTQITEYLEHNVFVFFHTTKQISRFLITVFSKAVLHCSVSRLIDK